MLPPWSAPTARSQRPAATSAAHPEDEPPALRPFAYGLCTGPVAALNDAANMAMFSHTACPTIVAPASSRRVTTFRVCVTNLSLCVEGRATDSPLRHSSVSNLE